MSAFAWALHVERCAPWTSSPVSTTACRATGSTPRSFPSAWAFLGLTAGLDRLGVSRVIVCMYLIPVAGVGLSAAFFGDSLTAARVLGGLIVLLGVILTRVALDRSARVPV